MRMEKGFAKTVAIIAIVIIGVGAVGIGVLRNIERNMEDLKGLPLMDIDFSAIPDGSYSGEFSRFPVSAEVEVLVEEEKFSRIDLLNHRHGPGYGAEAILERVIQEQSLQVDVISGATYSSIVVLKAIEDALLKGLD